MGGGAHHHPSAQHRVYVKLKHTSALVEVKVVKSTKIQGGFIASARAPAGPHTLLLSTIQFAIHPVYVSCAGAFAQPLTSNRNTLAQHWSEGSAQKYKHKEKKESVEFRSTRNKKQNKKQKKANFFGFRIKKE